MHFEYYISSLVTLYSADICNMPFAVLASYQLTSLTRSFIHGCILPEDGVTCDGHQSMLDFTWSSSSALRAGTSACAFFSSDVRKQKAESLPSCFLQNRSLGNWNRAEQILDRQVDLLDVHTVPPKWRGDAHAPQYQGEKPRETSPFLTA